MKTAFNLMLVVLSAVLLPGSHVAIGVEARADVTAPALAELRVCADPDNLPFSREDGSGFENRIAGLVADDLGVPLRYTWLPDRRAFIRKTLGAELCDVVIGVPAGFERAMTTQPYYRSSYVIVEREQRDQPSDEAGRRAGIDRYDDPRLAGLRIGVQLIGSDMAASPPGLALARQGLTANVEGFAPHDGPPAAERMVAALNRGDIDAAMLWGPQAGYFVARSRAPLRMHAAQPPALLDVPFEYSIAMGVRRADAALLARLDDVIARRRADIERILDEYAVPRIERAPAR